MPNSVPQWRMFRAGRCSCRLRRLRRGCYRKFRSCGGNESLPPQALTKIGRGSRMPRSKYRRRSFLLESQPRAHDDLRKNSRRTNAQTTSRTQDTQRFRRKNRFSAARCLACPRALEPQNRAGPAAAGARIPTQSERAASSTQSPTRRSRWTPV